MRKGFFYFFAPSAPLREDYWVQAVIPQHASRTEGDVAAQQIHPSPDGRTPFCANKSQYQNFDSPFEIPDSWEWVRLGEICDKFTTGPFGSTLHKSDYSEIGIPLINPANILVGCISSDNIKRVNETKARSLSQFQLKLNDIILPRRGNLRKCATISKAENNWLCGTGSFMLHLIDVLPTYFLLVYQSEYCQEILISESVGGTMDNLNQDLLRNLLIPIPPEMEQKRIVEYLAHLSSIIDSLDFNSKSLISESAIVKSKILDLAMQGKLVPQDPSDEPAADMLRRVNPKAEIIGDNPHYPQLPDNWVYCKFGEIADIARGGSPRPIKSYITDNPNGINWIKISDAQGKYINATKEKIISDGAKKSRLVRKGDFLLTNSMSFGHPYILNIDGCIHDGWLVISPRMKSFDKNFLYYMLTSSFISSQFSSMAGGAVVSNLNSDKVASTIVPLLSICEQQRIVAKIEELYSILDDIEKSLTN